MTTSVDPRTRRQKGRSIAIALTLGVLVVIFYASTIVRFGKTLETRRMQVEQPKN